MIDPPAGTGEDLWRFSLAIYPAPGVASHCVALQDRCGADVNLVLALAWAGASGRGRVTAAELAVLDRAVGPLRRAVIEPLRAARRWLRPEAGRDDVADLGDLRTRIKAVELEAERRVQMRLAVPLQRRPVIDPPVQRLAAAVGNVETYLRHLGAVAVPGPLIPAIDAWIREQM